MDKRKDYISWEEYFMYIACLSAKRSKDPLVQVGCCIVNKDTNRIISIGYNGMPNGCNDDDFPWGKSKGTGDVYNEYNEHKKYYVCHAELNAILNCNNRDLLKDSVLYCTLFPCNECMKAIIQSGIKEIVYLKEDDKPNTNSILASKKMIDYLGIKLKKIDSNLLPPITINP